MSRINVLMIGTGEYTTGFAHGVESASDKSAGVVGLSLFDLRRRGKIDRLLIAGTNGLRFPLIRQHLQRAIGDRYRGMDLQMESFPQDTTERDPEAYLQGLNRLEPGDAVTIFTPDDTHFEIAMAAIQRRCHVLIAKPMVKTLAEHRKLIEAAADYRVLVAMEVHKRWDPIYVDARNRIRTLGGFGFFHSYMSQPKKQLETFRQWAGKSSDISYYLNAHHVDFHCWSVLDFAEPVSVIASASTGVAMGKGIGTEDTITLLVRWKNREGGSMGTAVYTASWIAPQSDVHSQQRFFYLGHHGELQVDQAHRGYSCANDSSGYASPNPLFMSYTPDSEGMFAGQHSYGYRSIEEFVDAVLAIRSGAARATDFSGKLATVESTSWVSAILEAGRKSLDQNGIEISISPSAP